MEPQQPMDTLLPSPPTPIQWDAFAPEQCPIDQTSTSQLAPYLTGLNLSDAVQSFASFADTLLERETANQLSFECSVSALSPESLSTPPVTQSVAALSPAPSSDSFGCASSGWTCMSSSSSHCDASYFSGYSGPSSVASSIICHDSANHLSRRSSVSRSSSLSSASSTTSSSRSGSRSLEKCKRKNATAAERYRRKLKGHKSSLAEQIELEESRQQRLRQQIEYKLSLYREFVELLARNTGQQDEELAELGEKSLLNVLRLVNPSEEHESSDLWSYLEHFRSISETSSGSSSETSTSTADEQMSTDSEELVYDFYSDQWVQQQNNLQQVTTSA